MFILKAFTSSAPASESSFPEENDRRSTQEQNFYKNKSLQLDASSNIQNNPKSNLNPDQKENNNSYEDGRFQHNHSENTNLFDNDYYEKNDNYVVYSSKDWIQVTKSKTRSNTSYSELKTSLRAGIPASMRPRIWMWLADIQQLQSQYERGIFQRLASAVNNEWEPEVKKDLHRTMGDSPFFSGPDSKGQKSLFRVINAFCNIDSSGTGYAQGTNMIVAIILLTLYDQRNFKNPKQSFGVAQVTDSMIEEWAFWIFFFIMHEKNHYKIFQQNMVKRYQLLDALQTRIKDHSPKVLNHLKDQEIELGSVFDHELFSILACKCPLPLAQLAMDMFLLDGHTGLIDIMARIVQLNEQTILQINEFDKLMNFLKNEKNQVTWERYHKATYMLVPFECIISQKRIKQ